eukprot:2345952-Rhodomonas_salina.1
MPRDRAVVSFDKELLAEGLRHHKALRAFRCPHQLAGGGDPEARVDRIEGVEARVEELEHLEAEVVMLLFPHQIRQRVRCHRHWTEQKGALGEERSRGCGRERPPRRCPFLSHAGSWRSGT